MLLVALNAFFVAGEFALVSVERSTVERKARDQERFASRILTSLKNLSFELSGAQLGITITSLVLGAVAEPTIAQIIDPFISSLPFVEGTSAPGISIAVALGLATISQMIFGELVPKNLAIARPYSSSVWFAVPMQYVNKVLRPLILVLNNSANWTVQRLGIEPREELAGVRSMEELELMVRSSGEGGRLDDYEMELLTRAINFTENAASDAMIPRVHVVALERHTPVSDMLTTAMSTGHSRFPVFDQDLDVIVGIAHVKDIPRIEDARRAATEIDEISRPALVVPESATLESVLTELQTTGRGMAIVVDEYGGTAGILTVEDLLEEIFGEIEDEHDPTTALASEFGDADLVSGLLHRHEVAELTGYEWPEGRYETLGGYVVAANGTIPSEGDVVTADNLAFEVVEMDGLRVAQVRITPIGPETPT